MLDADFALFNVDRLVTLAPDVHPEARGELSVLDRAALASRDGKIVWIGGMDEMQNQVRLTPDATVVNTHGRVVLPGFVDAHTHPVFSGDRAGDFYARALGESYSSQLASGGIMQTIRATRAASEDTLLDLTYARADTFLQHGTTAIGGKTGYGLTREDELKSLRVLNRLQHLHPLKVVPTFLGAHVLPDDYDGDADAYLAEIADQWLPDVKDRAEFVDVWCDEGVFTVDQCRRLLTRAREMGFSITAHVNELGTHGGARMAAELGATSVDHAVYLEDEDIQVLARSDTVAVLLPGTTFFLGSKRYAPARELLEAGVPVALGTDFNPGTSYTQNMQLILTLAVLELGMTPEEAIKGATLIGARAIGLDACIGSLQPGKYCDLQIYAVDDYVTIPYRYGMNQVESVVACGEVVVQDGRVVANAPLPVYSS